jgi:hypothetical protein
MPVEKRDAVCLSCGARELLELNEPAGRRNNMDVQVWQCRVCHQTFTASQLWFGFPLSRQRPHTVGDEVWSLFFGVSLELAQTLRGICGCNEELALSAERIGRASAHIIDALAPDSHRPSRGPDPIGNDLYADLVARGFRDGPPAMRVVGEQPPQIERLQLEAAIGLMSNLYATLSKHLPEIAEYLAEVEAVLTPELAVGWSKLPQESIEQLNLFARKCLAAVTPAIGAALDVQSQGDIGQLIERFPEVDAIGEQVLTLLSSIGVGSQARALRPQTGGVAR